MSTPTIVETHAVQWKWSDYPEETWATEKTGLSREFAVSVRDLKNGLQEFGHEPRLEFRVVRTVTFTEVIP